MRKVYYTNIHRNPSICLRLFLPLIKRAVETRQRITTKESIPINGLDYTLYLTPVVNIFGDGIINLTLKWEDDGETYKQHITLIEEESNLVSGSIVYYFLSSGFKCRKLFYIGGRWRDRRSFRHKYESQSKSHLQRTFNHLPEPYRRYGKEYYRGKLTPYGKRCMRYEERGNRKFKALTNFLSWMSKRTGK